MMNHIPRDVKRKLNSSSAEIDSAFKARLKQQLFKEPTMAKQSSTFASFISQLRTMPALAALAVIVVTGTTSALIATNRAEVAHRQEIEVPADLDKVLGIDKVKELAIADGGGATIVGIELEKEDVGLVYKVKFSDGTVRYYNALTGAPLANTDGNNDDVPVGAISGALSLTEARRIASQQRPNATIIKIELENEDGVAVYSVRFSDGGRVDVNAFNGEVMRIEGASSSQQSGDDDSSDDSTDTSSSNNDSSETDDSESGDDNSGSGSSNSGSGSRDD